MVHVNIPAIFEVYNFSVPEIIGGTRRMWAVLGHARAQFLKNYPLLSQECTKFRFGHYIHRVHRWLNLFRKKW